jgi:hypothetical protein
VERLFEILKDTLANSEDLLISGYGKFSVKQKNAGSKGFGVQGFWGAEETDEYSLTGIPKNPGVGREAGRTRGRASGLGSIRGHRVISVP